MSSLDPRLNAFRSDLADKALEGKVEANHFVTPKLAQVVSDVAPVKQAPRFDSSLDTEALFGESVKIFDEAEGWAWVQLVRDNYVGYMPAECFTANISEPTHRVSTLRTFLYPAPDMKVPHVGFLSLNAAVTVTEESGNFSRIASGSYIYKTHLTQLIEFDADFVAVAERLVGTPYLWGGRSTLGIDCSGLVQLSMQAAGKAVPRDSDMQQQLGIELPFDENLTGLQRGDLVFWKGHVGIMIDSRNLLHANGYHMSTVIEPLHEAVTRINETYGKIKIIKRM